MQNSSFYGVDDALEANFAMFCRGNFEVPKLIIEVVFLISSMKKSRLSLLRWAKNQFR